ncbi:MAG: type II secretion system protein [Bacilli bacterium]|nr:type II secretion system protein [Bacilli bacterium]
MKKKGFTLIELLAVVILLSIITVIAVPITLSYVEKSKKSAYQVSVQNIFDAAKIYITSLEEDGDFPKGGILITDENLNLKNSKFTSGVIYKDDEGSIYVENVTNGVYCATGTKSDLQIIKGDCKYLDTTPPDLSIKLNNRTSSSITIVAYAEDNQSDIKGYSYSLDGQNWSAITTKQLYTVNNLGKVETIKIYVRAYNNKYDENMDSNNDDYQNMINISMTEASGEYTTLEVDAPKFKLSTESETSGTVKNLQIIYPKKEEGYIYDYSVVTIDVKDEMCTNIKASGNLCSETNFANLMTNWTTVLDTTAQLTLKTNSFIIARIKYNNKYVYSKIDITGIINEGPKADYEITSLNPKYNEWSRQKQININVEDTSFLAKKAFSFDNGKTWQSDNYYIASSNSIIKALVRDKVGNITKVGDDTGKIAVVKIDDTAPIKPSLSWTSSSTTTIDVKINSSDSQSGIKKYICYYGTSENNMNSSVEVISTANEATCNLINLDVGVKYYIKASVFDNVDNYSQSDIIVATPSNKLSSGYNDKCNNESYCNNDSGMYVQFGNYVFVVYQKDNYKAILNGVYSATSYGYNNCCDNGYSCTYSTNNFTTSLIGTTVLNSNFLSLLPATYKNYINQATYNTGWITLASSVSTSHTYSKTLSSATVTSTANIASRQATVYVGLIDYEEFMKVKDRTYFYDNVAGKYFWLSNLGLINNAQSLIDSYYYISFALAVRYNAGYEYLYETPNIANAYARPVISFKGDDEILSGKGTKTSPYVLKTS